MSTAVKEAKEKKKRRNTAIYAVFMYMCIVTLVLLLPSMTISDPPILDIHNEKEVEVIIESTGGGGGSTAAGDPSETVNPEPNVAEETPTEDVHTVEESDYSVPTGGGNTQTDEEAPVQSNPLFEFGGMQGNGNDGDGTGDGSEDGDGSGTGPQGNGPGISGTGDRIVYKIPKFDWENARGVIVVRMIFYPNGKVKDAYYVASKSTINDQALIKKCVQEAKTNGKAEPISGAELQQYDYRFNFSAN